MQTLIFSMTNFFATQQPIEKRFRGRYFKAKIGENAQFMNDK